MDIPNYINRSAWLIEAPGQNYLGCRRIGELSDFYWTRDHNKALWLYSDDQAKQLMMAVRDAVPKLWAFAPCLGEAIVVEHVWMEKS